MPNDKSNRRPQDTSKINVHESWELDWWSSHFGVSKEKLQQAIKAVGVSADAVKRYLQK
jgi:hypothetical protein